MLSQVLVPCLLRTAWPHWQAPCTSSSLDASSRSFFSADPARACPAAVPEHHSLEPRTHVAESSPLACRWPPPCWALPGWREGSGFRASVPPRGPTLRISFSPDYLPKALPLVPFHYRLELHRESLGGTAFSPQHPRDPLPCVSPQNHGSSPGVNAGPLPLLSELPTSPTPGPPLPPTPATLLCAQAPPPNTLPPSPSH